MVYTGIPSAEIIAACDLLQVPPAERAHVLYGIRVMVNATIDGMNSRG